MTLQTKTLITLSLLSCSGLGGPPIKPSPSSRSNDTWNMGINTYWSAWDKITPIDYNTNNIFMKYWTFAPFPFPHELLFLWDVFLFLPSLIAPGTLILPQVTTLIGYECFRVGQLLKRKKLLTENASCEWEIQITSAKIALHTDLGLELLRKILIMEKFHKFEENSPFLLNGITLKKNPINQSINHELQAKEYTLIKEAIDRSGSGALLAWQYTPQYRP